jgi:hypothetical protein
MLRQFDCAVNESVMSVFPPCNGAYSRGLRVDAW